MTRRTFCKLVAIGFIAAIAGEKDISDDEEPAL